MPRFVLLYHACPPTYERSSHWDFMLEAEATLRTWALEQLPHDWNAPIARTAASGHNSLSLAARNVVPALQLGDHRREYLKFEGSLSGDRGTVVRVAAGTFAFLFDTQDACRLSIDGDGIAGSIALTRLTPESVNWSLEYEPTR